MGKNFWVYKVVLNDETEDREDVVASEAARIEAALRQKKNMEKAISDPGSWLNQSERFLTKPVADELHSLHGMGFSVTNLHATHPRFSRSAVLRAATGVTYQK